MKYDGITGRVINAIHSGDIELLNVLFHCNFLEPLDMFDLTGLGRHGKSSDCVTMLHIVAKKRCPDYRELIDIMLQNGVPLNYSTTHTALEDAIVYQNFPTAFYLETLGGTHSFNNPDDHSEYVNKLYNNYVAYKELLLKKAEV